MTTPAKIETVHIHRVYIKATPEAIWEAITKPEWTTRYGYRAPVEYDLHPGGAYRAFATEAMQSRAGTPEVIVDGEIVEWDPPRRLVQTWRAIWTGEGFTRLTWEIKADEDGVTTLTLTHDVEGTPNTAAQVAGAVEGAGGGWSQVLSDLKTLLETGSSLYS